MNRDVLKARLFAYRSAGLITLPAYVAGLAMVRLANKQGRLSFPEAYIAKVAGLRWAKCVQRAKASLESAGFLLWQTEKTNWNRFAPCAYQLRTPPALEQPETTEKPAALKKEKYRARFSVGVSYGSPAPLAPDLQAALRRLGAAIGCSPDMVAPWLATDPLQPGFSGIPQ